MNQLAPLLVIYILLNSVVFLPLHDGRARGHRVPIVTLALIGVNVGIYVAQSAGLALADWARLSPMSCCIT